MKKALLIAVMMMVMVGMSYSKDFEDLGKLSSVEVNEQLNHQGKFLFLTGFYEASGYYYHKIQDLKDNGDLTKDQVEILDQIMDMLYMEDISVGPTVDEFSYDPRFYSSTDNFWDKLREEFHNK